MAKALLLSAVLASAIVAPVLSFHTGNLPLLLKKSGQLRSSHVQPIIPTSRLGRVAYHSHRIVMSSSPKEKKTTTMSREERLAGGDSNSVYKRVRARL
jgi:hypothetical protein